MKNVLRRVSSLVLTLAVAMSMTCTVFAGEYTNNDVEMYTNNWIYENGEDYISLFNADWDDETNEPVINSVTVSDTSVCKAVHRGSDWFLKGVKPGKVSFTVNYTLKGNSGQISGKMTIKKFPLVFKSVKVNGKKYKPTKTKYSYGVVKKAKKATKVKIKPVIASGWKIKSAKAYAYKNANSNPKTFKVSVKTIKKGRKIKFAKKYKNMTVAINMVNKKTGEKFTYCVHFYRNKAFAKW